MLIDCYLLDTSVASAAWDYCNPLHSKVRSELDKLDPQHIYICLITIAEMEYGLKTAPIIDEKRQQQTRAAMLGYKIFPQHEDGSPYLIDRHTTEEYSNIRTELFKKYSPKKIVAGLHQSAFQNCVNAQVTRN